MSPKYTLDNISTAVDYPTFERGMGLFEGGRVLDFVEKANSYSARVAGKTFYNVTVSAENFKQATCDCYLGQNHNICKHIVALAAYAVTRMKDRA